PGSQSQLAVALLSMCVGLQALPPPRRVDHELDTMVNLAKNILHDTKIAFRQFKLKFPSEGEHRLETLPVLSGSASDLGAIQVTNALSKIDSDLRSYEEHFEWLKKAEVISKAPLEQSITKIHSKTQNLANHIEHLMNRHNIPKSNFSPPQLPPQHATHWSAVHAGHAIFHHFKLFMDWTVRALVVLQNKH
uniref:Interleukin 11 n=1 Tax=Latimeria chalumnae TaxID=7897 RepID=H3A6V0_LATCH